MACAWRDEHHDSDGEGKSESAKWERLDPNSVLVERALDARDNKVDNVDWLSKNQKKG